MHVASSVWPSHVWGDGWLRLDPVAPVQGVPSDCHAPQSPLGFTFCTQLKGSCCRHKVLTSGTCHWDLP